MKKCYHHVCLNILLSDFQWTSVDSHTKFSLMIEITNFEYVLLEDLSLNVCKPLVCTFSQHFIKSIVSYAVPVFLNGLCGWGWALRCKNVANNMRSRSKVCQPNQTGTGTWRPKVMPNPLYPYCNIFHVQWNECFRFVMEYIFATVHYNGNALSFVVAL